MSMSRKEEKKPVKGTPTPADREVLRRAGEPVSGEAPDAGGFEGNETIKPVDLSLHGDGITDWQDEPMSARKRHREREEERTLKKKGG
ncbi:hypothetical protein [Chelativorans sp. AA-79]|uniref:hypothetical protein n=1 Tax=Chelativorans sp. AA-79 TaxID=3028735 RepID=UPI0023F82B4F|nr:hypothetical protein [Chelativorans sp. AA-79]WEX10185.1 hypothetical protein PVE73_04295 [Chelativorans sp. AA-79]